MMQQLIWCLQGKEQSVPFLRTQSRLPGLTTRDVVTTLTELTLLLMSDIFSLK